MFMKIKKNKKINSINASFIINLIFPIVYIIYKQKLAQLTHILYN